MWKPFMLCLFVFVMGVGTLTSVFRTLQLITTKLLPVNFGFVFSGFSNICSISRSILLIFRLKIHRNLFYQMVKFWIFSIFAWFFKKPFQKDRETFNLRFSQRHFGKLSLGHNYGMFRFWVSSLKLFLSIWITYSSTVGCVFWLPQVRLYP